MYHECLFDEQTTSATYFQIASSNHQLSTNKITKSALSPYDDKRYLLPITSPNLHDTLAYGHYKIKK